MAANRHSHQDRYEVRDRGQLGMIKATHDCNHTSVSIADYHQPDKLRKLKEIEDEVREVMDALPLDQNIPYAFITGPVRSHWGRAQEDIKEEMEREMQKLFHGVAPVSELLDEALGREAHRRKEKPARKRPEKERKCYFITQREEGIMEFIGMRTTQKAVDLTVGQRSMHGSVACLGIGRGGTQLTIRARQRIGAREKYHVIAEGGMMELMKLHVVQQTTMRELMRAAKEAVGGKKIPMINLKSGCTIRLDGAELRLTSGTRPETHSVHFECGKRDSEFGARVYLHMINEEKRNENKQRHNIPPLQLTEPSKERNRRKPLLLGRAFYNALLCRYNNPRKFDLEYKPDHLVKSEESQRNCDDECFEVISKPSASQLIHTSFPLYHIVDKWHLTDDVLEPKPEADVQVDWGLHASLTALKHSDCVDDPDWLERDATKCQDAVSLCQQMGEVGKAKNGFVEPFAAHEAGVEVFDGIEVSCDSRGISVGQGTLHEAWPTVHEVPRSTALSIRRCHSLDLGFEQELRYWQHVMEVENVNSYLIKPDCISDDGKSVLLSCPVDAKPLDEFAETPEFRHNVRANSTEVFVCLSIAFSQLRACNIPHRSITAACVMCVREGSHFRYVLGKFSEDTTEDSDRAIAQLVDTLDPTIKEAPMDVVTFIQLQFARAAMGLRGAEVPNRLWDRAQQYQASVDFDASAEFEFSVFCRFCESVLESDIYVVVRDSEVEGNQETKVFFNVFFKDPTGMNVETALSELYERLWQAFESRGRELGYLQNTFRSPKYLFNPYYGPLDEIPAPTAGSQNYDHDPLVSSRACKICLVEGGEEEAVLEETSQNGFPAVQLWFEDIRTWIRYPCDSACYSEAQHRRPIVRDLHMQLENTTMALQKLKSLWDPDCPQWREMRAKVFDAVLEVVRAMEKASGKTLEHEIGPRRPGDLATTFCCPDKIKRTSDSESNEFPRGSKHFIRSASEVKIHFSSSVMEPGPGYHNDRVRFDRKPALEWSLDVQLRRDPKLAVHTEHALFNYDYLVSKITDNLPSFSHKGELDASYADNSIRFLIHHFDVILDEQLRIQRFPPVTGADDRVPLMLQAFARSLVVPPLEVIDHGVLCPAHSPRLDTFDNQCGVLLCSDCVSLHPSHPRQSIPDAAKECHQKMNSLRAKVEVMVTALLDNFNNDFQCTTFQEVRSAAARRTRELESKAFVSKSQLSEALRKIVDQADVPLLADFHKCLSAILDRATLDRATLASLFWKHVINDFFRYGILHNWLGNSPPMAQDIVAIIEGHTLSYMNLTFPAQDIVGIIQAATLRYMSLTLLAQDIVSIIQCALVFMDLRILAQDIVAIILCATLRYMLLAQGIVGITAHEKAGLFDQRDLSQDSRQNLWMRFQRCHGSVCENGSTHMEA